MKGKRILAAVLTVSLLFTGATALAAGSSADPLVSRSYLKTVFQTPMEDYWKTARQMMDSTVQLKLDGLKQEVEACLSAKLAESLTARVSAALAGQTGTPGLSTAGMQQIRLKKGDRVTGTPGGAMIFVNGAGKICGSSGSEVLNVTAGSVRKPGAVIKTGIFYMILASDGSGIEVTSDTADVLVKDGAWGGYQAQYTRCADGLYQLGLFKGTGTGYELERAPSRQEALVMLIRLLGEEQKALACTAKTPFTDPPVWADGMKYISYGYSMGYTNGTSKTTFSPTASSAAEQYLTFVLRSLGYQDGSDFEWNTTSRDLAVILGLVTWDELDSMAKTGFMRDHVVLLSWRALGARLKDGSGTLADKLMAQGVITRSQLENAYRTAGQ